jgi:hypothetical protein
MATGKQNFWTSNALEPKRQYRFRLTITAVGGSGTVSNAIWFAKKVTIPQFTVGEVKHSFVDKTFYFPGRVEWNTIEATLVDPVNPDAVDITNKMLVGSGYFVPNNTNGNADWGSMSKAEANTAIGQVVIDIIDQDGAVLEQWTLNNPFIKSVKFGELSYDSDELREIGIEFRYDWAQCSVNGADHFKAVGDGKKDARKDSDIAPSGGGPTQSNLPNA